MSHDQFDLFDWAAMQTSAVVIDAREKFLLREIAFIRLLMIGYKPPTSGGHDPIDLTAYRTSVNCRSNSRKTSRNAAA